MPPVAIQQHWRRVCKTPFRMPNLWPAHLIFLSLLYQSNEVRLYRH